MSDTELRIDDLPLAAVADLYHVIPVMKDGHTVAIAVDQIIDLIDAGVVGPIVSDIIAEAPEDDAFADTDKFFYLVDGAPMQGSLAGLVSSIFKTGRTIGNAQFEGASFKLFNAGGKGFRIDVVALSADRKIIMPDRDVNLGWTRTWQNMTASRAWNTSYQNTGAEQINVSIRAVAAVSNPLVIQTSTDNVSWSNTGGTVTSTGGLEIPQAIVPPGSYYRLSNLSGSTGPSAITSWWELR